MDKNSIERISRKWASGMSPEQVSSYVINSHVTKDRQIKQALLECENRYHNLEKIIIERKKSDVEYRKLKQRLQTEQDPFERELIELDIQGLELDFNVYERRKVTVEKELDVFVEYLMSLDMSEEELEQKLEYDPTEERKYWIARMGKQAALDFITNGRIGSGNLDSISMMSEEDQLAIFEVAIHYSSMLQVSFNKIQQKLSPYLKELEKTATMKLPTFHGIEESLELPLLKQMRTVNSELELNESRSSTPASLQLTYKPENS